MALTHGPTNTYANIVTSGLILNLDASNPSSYPGSGTTWNDLSNVMGNVIFKTEVQIGHLQQIQQQGSCVFIMLQIELALAPQELIFQ